MPDQTAKLSFSWKLSTIKLDSNQVVSFLIISQPLQARFDAVKSRVGPFNRYNLTSYLLATSQSSRNAVESYNFAVLPISQSEFNYVKSKVCLLHLASHQLVSK